MNILENEIGFSICLAASTEESPDTNPTAPINNGKNRVASQKLYFLIVFKYSNFATSKKFFFIISLYL